MIYEAVCGTGLESISNSRLTAPLSSNYPILDTRISVHRPPSVTLRGTPPWILKRGGPESSGQQLISSIGKTKIIALFLAKNSNLSDVWNFLGFVKKFLTFLNNFLIDFGDFLGIFLFFVLFLLIKKKFLWLLLIDTEVTTLKGKKSLWP